MNTSYFGFSEAPFEGGPDERFLFFSTPHREVTAVLLNFVRMNKGFALLTGEAGTGKSMVTAYLTGRLPEDVHPVRVSGPEEGYCGILKAAAGVLGIERRECAAQELADAVKRVLTEEGRGAERFLVIVEDCHRFSDEGIESVRLLGNIEAPERKLFQILFTGRPEFLERLNRPELRQVRQRLNVIRELSPMDETDTVSYADFRLKAAGASFDGCFDDGCRRPLFRLTRGVPAAVNRLCTAALEICAEREGKKVCLADLKVAAGKLRDAGFPGESRGLRMGAPPLKFLRFAALGAAAVLAMGWAGYYGYVVRESGRRMLQTAAPVMQQEPAAAPAPEAENPVAAVNLVPPADNGVAAADSVPAADPSEPVSSPLPPIPEPVVEAAAVPGEAAPAIGEAGALPQEKTWKVAISPLVSVQGASAKRPSAGRHPSQRIRVKKGDTLTGIAARYFPGNTAAGIRKIRSANPDVDAGGRVYAGQTLIIPGR